MAPTSEAGEHVPGSHEPGPTGSSGAGPEPPRPPTGQPSLHAAAELALRRVHERVGRPSAAVRRREGSPLFGGVQHDPEVRPTDDSRPESEPPPAEAEAPSTPETVRVPEEPPRRSRVIIRELVVERGGPRVQVVATLTLGERAGSGTAEAPPTRSGLWRGVAEATVEALAALMGSDLQVGIDRITVASYDEPPTVRVLLTALGGAGEETLLGATLLREDPAPAVMRATLDALNGRIEPLLHAASVAAPAG